MSNRSLAALTQKHCLNTSKRTTANSDISHSDCNCKENEFYHKRSLSIVGERMQLFPIPKKTSTDLGSQRDTVDDERGIVLRFYKEVREKESLNDLKKILPWSRNTEVKNSKFLSRPPTDYRNWRETEMVGCMTNIIIL